MNYESWLNTVPGEIKGDALWRMEVYRLSVFSTDLAWHDVTKLIRDRRTISLAHQLNRAIGSISANIAEGYSRQSGKDQARFYEYALGSARESRNWYYQGRHVLTESVATHRMQLMTQIIRLLLCIVPAERGYKMEEEPAAYNSTPMELINSPPIP
jgi:four helix bundle protein